MQSFSINANNETDHETNLRTIIFVFKTSRICAYIKSTREILLKLLQQNQKKKKENKKK